MNILVLNCGSSSVKFALFEDEIRVLKGIIERIGFHDAKVYCVFIPNSEKEEYIESILDHQKALKILSNIIKKYNFTIDVIGHRVVHGAEKFVEPVIIDEKVKEDIKECIPLAPLHNPYHLIGIEISEQLFPEAKNVAVFDTAFHKTIPEEVAIYPLPYEYYEKYKIRKYGFHGTSHYYLMLKTAEVLNQPPQKLKLITCHLGNGASITAIKYAKSVDTSMGFTPEAGLMMGTRAGDVDPSCLVYLQKIENLTPKDIDYILTKKSGLLGISGISSDMREIISLKDKNPKANLAFRMYCYRVKRYISSYIGILNGVDCIVFSAGVGENSPIVREEVLKDMDNLGILIDNKKNYSTIGKDGFISAEDSKIKVLVLKTDEELMIAKIAKEITK
ncbi:MAG: acetate/propionate family kinase [Endomicrobiia bacterium]